MRSLLFPEIGEIQYEEGGLPKRLLLRSLKKYCMDSNGGKAEPQILLDGKGFVEFDGTAYNTWIRDGTFFYEKIKV